MLTKDEEKLLKSLRNVASYPQPILDILKINITRKEAIQRIKQLEKKQNRRAVK